MWSFCFPVAGEGTGQIVEQDGSCEWLQRPYCKLISWHLLGLVSKTGRLSWELKPRLWMPPGKGLWGQPLSYHPSETLLNQSAHRAVVVENSSLLRLGQCSVACRALSSSWSGTLSSTLPSLLFQRFSQATVWGKKVPSPPPSRCWLNQK